MKFVASCRTFLKTLPAPPQTLSPSQLYMIPQGTTIKISEAFYLSRVNHFKIFLSESINGLYIWYVYGDHIKFSPSVIPDHAGKSHLLMLKCFEQIKDLSQIAYVMATVEHETNNTFEPVREAYYLGEPEAENYRKTLNYYPYYGRGLVQLTWLDNYKFFTEVTKIDFVNYPDKALNQDIAMKILLYGMIHGSFTGFRLIDFIDQKVDFVGARKIINGSDRADHIADLAKVWRKRIVS